MSDKIDPREKLILIVDDDDTVLDFFRFAVEKDGFKVITARDGEEALKKVHNTKPDLIIADMMMPGKGGYEVICSLQAGELWKIPVIIVSGKFVDDKFKNNILFEQNVKEYFVKPVKSPVLMHKIHSLLNTISPEEKQVEINNRELNESLKPKISEQ